MTPVPPQIAALPLDPTTLDALLRGITEALPHLPTATEADKAGLQRAALGFLALLHPRDPMEAVLAAQIVITHFAGLYDFACAARPDLPAALQLRYQGRAISLIRLSDQVRRELIRRQGGPVARPVALQGAMVARSEPVAASSAPAQAAEAAPPAAPADAGEAPDRVVPIEGRHERRRRERAERHLAAAARRGGLDVAADMAVAA